MQMEIRHAGLGTRHYDYIDRMLRDEYGVIRWSSVSEIPVDKSAYFNDSFFSEIVAQKGETLFQAYAFGPITQERSRELRLAMDGMLTLYSSKMKQS